MCLLSLLNKDMMMMMTIRNPQDDGQLARLQSSTYLVLCKTANCSSSISNNPYKYYEHYAGHAGPPGIPNGEFPEIHHPKIPGGNCREI